MDLVIGHKEADVDFIIHQMNEHCNAIDVELRVVTVLKDGKEETEDHDFFKMRRGFTYSEFLWLFDSQLDEKDFPYYPVFYSLGIISHVQRRGYTSRYSDDALSYVLLLQDEMGEMVESFFSRRAATIPMIDLYEHMYVCGSTGSGKSTFLKVLFLRLAEKFNKSSQLMFDPHGDLTRAVKRYYKFYDADRFILVDVGLKDGYIPTINPLETKDKSKRNMNKLARRLAEIMEESMLKGISMTDHMITILLPIVQTLLLKGDATLNDIHRFLDSDRNHDLLELSEKLKSPISKNIIKTIFSDKKATQQVEGIRKRLSQILIDDDFREFLCGKSTFDLEEAMNHNKIVVFNFEHLDRKIMSVVGRFLLTMITNIALARDPDTKKHTYFFIDECHNFISDNIGTILDEARKYGLHLILANQYIDQIKDKSVQDSIKSNTSIKVIGKNNYDQLKMFTDNMGLTKYDFQHAWGIEVKETQSEKRASYEDRQLRLRTLKEKRGRQRQKYTFFLKSGDRKTMLFKTDVDILGKEFQMSPEQQKEFDEKQLSKYYRKTDDSPKDFDDFSPANPR